MTGPSRDTMIDKPAETVCSADLQWNADENHLIGHPANPIAPLGSSLA